MDSYKDFSKIWIYHLTLHDNALTTIKHAIMFTKSSFIILQTVVECNIKLQICDCFVKCCIKAAGYLLDIFTN